VIPHSPSYRLGVVEGYFGKQWSWQCRRDYAQFLQSQAFTSYIYAPKNDAFLRKQWHVPYNDSDLQQLVSLREHYSHHRIEFGIGLSPYELYRDFSAANKTLLANKLTQLNRINPETLCILFDDMMGDLADLASIQLDIVDFIRSRSSATRFILCPTYYSYDPLLSKYFGVAPEHYLDQLGQQLAPDMDIFWTGPKVISAEYPAVHLMEVAQRLQRKPLLWDNYPVNDAKRLTPFLHLGPFPKRDSHQLQTLCAGHLCNPMNQGYLSQLSLWTLAAIYRGSVSPVTLDGALHALCSAQLAGYLGEDQIRFQQEGLEKFSQADIVRFIDRYTSCSTEAMSAEIISWLKGDYTFDPACLT